MAKKNKAEAKSKPKVVKKAKLNLLPHVASAPKKGIIPLNDRVLVKPIDSEELNKTASGIIIPDTVTKEKPEQGIVVEIGDGRWENGARVPMAIEVGDRVIFSKYGYDEIKVEGVEYYILKEDQILAVIKN
jgi:chaperonin GroES